MRNKWFAGGILVPALALTWGMIACLRGGMEMFAIVPAAIAIGLYVAAWKVSQSQSFSPQPVERGDVGTSKALKRWNDDRDERNAAAANKAALAAADASKGAKVL